MLDHVLYDTISLLTVILLLVVVEGAWWVADLPLAGLRRLIRERYNRADGTGVISGLNDPNESTAVHELAHVVRRFLFNRNTPVADRAGITDEDIQTIETWCHVPQSQRVIIRTVCMWAALTLPMVPATAQMDTRHAIGLQSWALLVALLEQVVAPLTFVRHWPITIIWTAMRVIQILTFATVMLMP